MSQVIASTYEIIKEIGAGGGGVVYLANHRRLGKTVVLKADKRGTSARLTSLRREVDILKELKHPYIPQVYDFFEYKGVIYTVIDFVEGESLNKPLKRGEKFSQPQVIKWAIELLEALCYLHSPTHGDPPRGFVHGDIKPANIMLNSQGDICLIDFNISLALGEDRVVGYSPGYASPEHYGLDFSAVSIMSGQQTTSEGRRSGFRLDSRVDGRTGNERNGDGEESHGDSVTFSGEKAQKVSSSVRQSTASGSSGGSYPTSMKKKILPDVRSDIYSLGATLYHFLSGVRPARDAREVVPLSAAEFSPQIVRIIAKSMNPNPDLRYQTAQEMLDDFLHLRERDERVRRRKRRNVCVYSFFLLLFLAGAAASFVGLKRMQVKEQWLKLAEYARNALSEGDTAAAVDYALETFPEKKSILQPDSIAEGQRVLTDAVGVYDLSDGYKTYETVELPAQPLFMRISPDGKTAACIYSWSVTVFDTVTCETLVNLPVEESALAEVEYLDNDTIIYAGRGGIKAHNIRKNTELWSGNPATGIAVSGDGTRAAAVYKDEEFATIYDTTDGKVVWTVDFTGRHQWTAVNDVIANPNISIFSLNYDGSLLGLSFSDGSLEVICPEDDDRTMILFDDTSGYTDFQGGFYKQYFAFSAANTSDSLFAIVDAEALALVGDMSIFADVVRVNEKGIFINQNNILVKIHPTTGEQTPLVNCSDKILSFDTDGEHTIVAGKEGYQFFDKNANPLVEVESDEKCDFVQICQGTALIGNMDSPAVRIMNYESCPESSFFDYDPSYVHKEVRRSQDGKTIMFFSPEQFRIYDVEGSLICEVFIPDPEQIYDQQYVRDMEGSRLEVIYNDGKVVSYSGSDGTVLSEEQREAPDTETYYEEFETDRFRIQSPLHGAPEVYDKKSGKLLRYLEEDAYLTYVTQIEDGIIVQYVTADGGYYGQLLNEKCEIIAELPYLCDVVDGTLLFDYPTGNVRQSGVYRIDQIIEFAKEQRGVKKDA